MTAQMAMAGRRSRLSQFVDFVDEWETVARALLAQGLPPSARQTRHRPLLRSRAAIDRLSMTGADNWRATQQLSSPSAANRRVDRDHGTF
jgi:hypothetical protein